MTINILYLIMDYNHNSTQKFWLNSIQIDTEVARSNFAIKAILVTPP